MQEENKKIVLDYVAAFNAGDTDALRRIFAEDALIYGPFGWIGLDEAVPVWKQLRSAFAFQLSVEEILTQDDTAVARFIERGTSNGTFQGQAATGKSSEVVAIEWFKLTNGRIQRRWGVRDSASHFRQMGLSVG